MTCDRCDGNGAVCRLCGPYAPSCGHPLVFFLRCKNCLGCGEEPFTYDEEEPEYTPARCDYSSN